jgi:hypothetical protein
MRPGLGGGRELNAASDSFPVERVSGLRTTRTFEGKFPEEGVAGRTLTEECGLRPLSLWLAEPVGEAIDVVVDDVDDALEWV